MEKLYKKEAALLDFVLTRGKKNIAESYIAALKINHKDKWQDNVLNQWTTDDVIHEIYVAIATLRHFGEQ